MKLFSKIPGRFFSVLASGNKELYVQATVRAAAGVQNGAGHTA